MNRSHCPLALLFIPLALACFALSPQARGACQEGCDTDTGNTFLGDEALINNTIGYDNTAIGASALLNNTIGFNNTAYGHSALLNNTAGADNTAIGLGALLNNTTGIDNTATGAFALEFNIYGTNNTANGYMALTSNTSGNYNTAIGFQALLSNSTGSWNTANGFNALPANTSGGKNTADGVNSLFKNITGVVNVAIGYNALFNNTTGGFNTALGPSAGYALTTGSNNIDIANKGVAAEANTIRIGTTGTQTNTYVAGISGVTVAGGVGVIIDSSGHLGTITSSARFKEAIKPMDKASETILALQPVTFRYKHDLDPDGVTQFGLVAEQVEKVNPTLVARDEQGKPYTVRYEAVNAMLLNEFLKEHGKVEKLETMVSSLAATVKEQAALIQKVSAQLELKQSAPKAVVNNQ
jgi:Chaperone of endosialidase